MREFKVGDKVKIPSEPDSKWVSNTYHTTLGVIGEVTSIFYDFYEKTLLIEFADSEDITGLFYYSPSYLLTEPYNQEKTMKAEENMSKLSNNQIEILKELRFEKLEVNLVQDRIMGALAGSDFETPQPKTRPMTHFEILKLDAVFRRFCKNICTNWNTEKSIDSYEYCLRSDFQKAETLEDVVWKKLEVEA